MDANTLRIILAVVGAFLLLGLYLWERRRSTPDEEDEPDEEELEARKREPRLGTWMEDHEDMASGPSGRKSETRDRRRGRHAADSEPAPEQLELPHEPDQPEFDLKPPPEPPSEFPAGPLILTLHVVSRGSPFDGADLVHAASRYGLEPGEMDIFHCMLGEGDGRQTLFSMANMVKPGSFPFGAMADFQSPGVTLFAQLEGTHDDPGRMEEMLGVAHSLADDLGGEIRDETRRTFSADAERRLRDRVMSFVRWRLTHQEPT